MTISQPDEQAANSHLGLRQRSSRDTSADVQRILGKVEANGRDLPILRLVANSPNVFRPFVLLSDALLNRAGLPARVREVVVLSIAAVDDIGYEWCEHVPIARDAGISDEEVEMIRTGHRTGFGEREDLAVEIATRLRAGDGIDSRDWAAAVNAWGLEAALDLVFSIAFWGGFIPMVIDALGLTRADVIRIT